MQDANLFDIALSILVLVGMIKIFYPSRAGKPARSRRNRSRTRRARVHVDPLLARERMLTAELREVRARIRARQSG